MRRPNRRNDIYPYSPFRRLRLEPLEEIIFSSSEEEEKESSSKQEKNNINNDNINKISEDLTECYICLNQSKDPVICRFCGNMACKKCFYKLLKEKNKKCGCCRKELTKEDLISPPIIKNISNYINKLQKEINHEICQIHKEKILFFCMKCLKKYCGKCLFFGSEESKMHQGHNIIDYSQIKNSEYNDIINRLETNKDNIDKIKELIINNKNYKEEIKIIFDNSKIALEFFQKEIENNFQEKINIISKYSKDLKEAKDDLEKKNKEIISNLAKLEKPDDKIYNFDAKKSIEELDIILNKIKLLKNISINLRNKEIKIDFKLNYFSLIKNYNELIKSKDNILVINEPLLIKMKLEEVKEKEEQSVLKIIIPNKDKNSFFVFVFFKLNNKIYHFELKDNEDDKDNNINIQINILDEIKDNKENKVYIAYIPKNELSQTDNVFYFANYTFSIE